MVIGDGLLARAFAELQAAPDVLVLASGVSDSTEQRPEAFERERQLVCDYLDTPARLVYFGSCSIYDPDRAGTAYVRHKRDMERLIEDGARDYTIFRLPQIVGAGGNAANIVASFAAKLRAGETVDVWMGAQRYLIDVADVVRLARVYLAHPMSRNAAINLAPPTGKTPFEIAVALEKVLGLRAQYRRVERGAAYVIPQPEPNLSAAAGVFFGDDYFAALLERYAAGVVR